MTDYFSTAIFDFVAHGKNGRTNVEMNILCIADTNIHLVNK